MQYISTSSLSRTAETPSLSFMASEDTQTQQTNNNNNHETSTPKSQRPPRKPNKPMKKVPQRGMGVAQLEHLMLQERWKKMADFTQLNNNTPHLPTTFDYLLNGAAPMQHGRPAIMGFEENFNFVCTQSNVSDRCGFCNKKKCPNGEKDKLMRISHEVEVIAVHRKGNSDVLMEYEFFPEKRDMGTCSKNLLTADAFADQTSSETSASAVSDQTAYSIQKNSLSPTIVDLALKL